MQKRWMNMFFHIFLGNILLAFSVCSFVVPGSFMLGGSTGIALTIQAFVPVRLSIITALVNGGLFALGLLFLGKSFAATSLLSTLIYPVIMAVFETLPLGELFFEDRLLCAIFTGLVMGAGLGVVLRAGGSTGGMDIPPCILQKYKGIPVGTSMMVFDLLILLLQVLNQGMNGILYSIVIIVLTSVTVNKIVIMGEGKVEMLIISPKYEQIREEILKNQDNGVTFLKIETGYRREDQKAILSILHAKQYPSVRNAVLEIDEDAFIIAASVMNVNGRGYTLARTNKLEDVGVSVHSM